MHTNDKKINFLEMIKPSVKLYLTKQNLNHCGKKKKKHLAHLSDAYLISTESSDGLISKK